MYEVANQASSITGGVDGLTDLPIGALFGKLPFGLDGRAACAYSFAILLGVFLLARRLVQSPFGLALRGIRENVRRMPAIGVNVNQRLRVVFAVAAGDRRDRRRGADPDHAARAGSIRSDSSAPPSS